LINGDGVGAVEYGLAIFVIPPKGAPGAGFKSGPGGGAAVNPREHQILIRTQSIGAADISELTRLHLALAVFVSELLAGLNPAHVAEAKSCEGSQRPEHQDADGAAGVGEGGS